jgi:hypothetical protein
LRFPCSRAAWGSRASKFGWRLHWLAEVNATMYPTQLYGTIVLSLPAVSEHPRLGDQPNRGVHDVLFPTVRKCGFSRKEDWEVARNRWLLRFYGCPLVESLAGEAWPNSVGSRLFITNDRCGYHMSCGWLRCRRIRAMAATPQRMQLALTRANRLWQPIGENLCGLAAHDCLLSGHKKPGNLFGHRLRLAP